MSSALQVLSDTRGTVTAGPLSASVYYIRVADFLSPALAKRFGALLRLELAASSSVSVFLDIEASRGSDFIARSAVVQAFFAQRTHIGSVTILVNPGPLASRARTLASMLGTPFQLVDSPAVFQARLCEVAPSARNDLPASGEMPIARALRPPTRSSLRPAARSMQPRVRSGTRG